MNQSFNSWWLLPLVTLGCGIAIAVFNHTPTPTISAATESLQQVPMQQPVSAAQTTNTPLQVTQVSLPPKPLPYQPRLTAKLKNDRVVVEQESALTTIQPKPATNAAVVEDFSRVKDSVQAGQLTASQSKLAQQFSQVMQEMANEEAAPKSEVKLHAQPLTLYPQWYQDLVPALEFSSHIYASNADDRWVRVNDQVVKEGELINANMRLVRVEPQEVVIEMQERHFTLPALSSW
ncbi:general secretion pathway protein GspB [Psychrobium sp. MM17-31]|uniref:general secretion pathway protein GspB n=1 Tax=Psychrobium sp. MM17-31 TaxID=2917758 RepID=UPI001EF45C2F|nr:general secretion pathway protein GspB [Psychrobium sp. MM17-31]MCG7532345.1 general secretion pathway protein GspB [Psychrobium sp. MM17-31]